MKKIILLLCYVTSLVAWDSNETIQKYSTGGYRTFLNNIDSDFKDTLSEGGFDAFLGERRKKLQPMIKDIKSRMQIQSKRSKDLRRITESENKMLTLAIAKQPDLPISQFVRALVNYNKLFEKNSNEVQRFSLIELGFVDMSTDPIAFQVHEIFTEYGLKESFINDDVLEGEISQETAEEYSFVLQLERTKKIRSVCLEDPMHPTAVICLKALEIGNSMVAVVGQRKHVTDLLMHTRAPESVVEQNVKEILQKHQALRDQVFKKTRK